MKCVSLSISVMVAIASIAGMAYAKNKTLDIPISPGAAPMTARTMTANVVNRSKTDVVSGAVTFDNNTNQCLATFGAIRNQGGSATSSCTLNGAALLVKAAFRGADGSTWVGVAGDGTEFDTIDINLNDQK